MRKFNKMLALCIMVEELLKSDSILDHWQANRHQWIKKIYILFNDLTDQIEAEAIALGVTMEHPRFVNLHATVCNILADFETFYNKES